MSLRGKADEALERLDQVDQECLRTLKVYQYWATYVGLLKLRQAMYKYDSFRRDASDMYLYYMVLGVMQQQQRCCFNNSLPRPMSSLTVDWKFRSAGLTSSLVGGIIRL